MATPHVKVLRQAALNYHAQSPAGKVAITATKPLLNARDLALAIRLIASLGYGRVLLAAQVRR